MHWVLMLLVRVVAFAIAIAFVTRRSSGVKVTPRQALPLVAVVFGVLNLALYWLISAVVTVGSLWTLSLVAPLIANALLLEGTSRLIKPLKIEKLSSLLYASLILTVVHLILRVAGL
jgi:uncharacterized membrane protein YvlD (DUF360 family)